MIIASRHRSPRDFLGPSRAAALVAALVGAIGVSVPARAQEAADDREAVLATVERLFEGMRRGDGAQVRSTFADGAQLIVTEDEGGQPALRLLPAERLAVAVEGATAEWDEPFWDPVVQVRDHLATVWTKYAFYLDREFHHCGVDAFTLARTPEGWKIVALADTRQTEGCEKPR